MVESSLLNIASILITKVGSLALQEIRLAWSLKTELKKLEENMITIKAVLLDAEQQQAHNRELGIWLGRLKNFCYDAGDVLDELDYEILHRRFVKQKGSTSKEVCRFFSQSNPVVVRISTSHKVKDLNERLDELAAQKSRFHLRERVDHAHVMRRQRELTDSLLRTSNVIGRQDDKEKIMRWLLQLGPRSEVGCVSVIPIVGIGGLGKTSLAKLLYNDKRVDENFELKMWVCVSEEFEKKEIMVKMIKFLTHQNSSDWDPEQLQIRIREKLKFNKFLLVLDDVWSDDRYKWSELRDLLEEGDEGSKVIVTTRSASVARTVGTVSAYNLKGLPFEDCLSLFKKWAFNIGEEERYPNRMEIGRDIVKKCGGLPLAVRTLATLLYERNEDHYWELIRDNEIWELEQKEDDILPTLKLSYDQMKPHLKPCFAICSIFPMDYEFSSYWLPRVWMVHGLLQSSGEGQDLEDIGLQYIKELYSKSFFQDFVDHGDFFVFKMHDLVHDLAVSVAKSDCSMITIRSRNIAEGIRHMSFFDEALLDKKIPEFLQNSSRLQTIFFQSKTEGPAIQSFVFNCVSSCKHLWMLDLAGSSFEVLPSSIGALKHLRYLNLSQNYGIKELPDSICNLHNLQSLCLGECLRLEKLPSDIRGLIELRCLVITVKQKFLPEDGIGSLKSLRFLSIEKCSNLEILFEGRQLPKSLRSLHISSCENLVSLPNLNYLTSLQNLLIKDCRKLNLMKVQESQHCGLSLQSLILEELPLLSTLPRWLIRSLKTLQCLSIRHCVYFSSLPEWIQSFTALKKIEIERCPELLKKTGEFWRRVAQVPQVSLNVELRDIPPVNRPDSSSYGGSSWPDAR